MPRPSGRPSVIDKWVRDQSEVFGSTTALASRVRRAVEAGLLRKLAARVYTRNLEADPADLLRRHLWDVLSFVVPTGCVLSFRTGFESRPNEEGHVWLSAPYTKVLELPGVHIHLVQAPGPLDGDRPFVGGMALASEPRVLLENLLPSRTRGGIRRTVSKSAIEERLDAILRSRGEDGLQAVREAARALAPSLGAEDAFEELNRMVAATLGSRPDHRARSDVLAAPMRGHAYDPGALARVDRLIVELNANVYPERHDAIRSGKAWDLIAFFDAYFSNYIEGIEFEVGEAREIVFEQKIPSKRPADAHDVLGTYALVADSGAMGRPPSSLGTGLEFETLLSRWHGVLMAQRPEVSPGEWKTAPNRAGDTTFVAPELARGTMRAGFERIRAMRTPFARAVGLMFLITEVHPFTDGNGRLARAVMNAELIAGEQRRIIIPTVYRDDYIGALRRLSRHNDPAVLPKMLDIAQTFTASLSFADFDTASSQLAQSNAFRNSDEARLLLPVERPRSPRI